MNKEISTPLTLAAASANWESPPPREPSPGRQIGKNPPDTKIKSRKERT